MKASGWRGLLVGALAAGLAAAGLGVMSSASAREQPPPTPKPGRVTQLVVGGDAATQPYSFMVSLLVKGEHECGGALIASSWVITAAHCSQPKQVRIGSVSWRSGGELIHVVKRVAAPKFNKKKFTAGSDLALLRLAAPTKLAPVKPAPVKLASNVKPGHRVRLMGWGLTCEVEDALECLQPAPTLHQLDTVLLNPGACTNNELGGIDGRREWCVSNLNGSKQGCNGDSGGPLLIQTAGTWRLIGVTSRDGDKDLQCGNGPAIWTNVLAHRGWITQVISGYGRHRGVAPLK